MPWHYQRHADRSDDRVIADLAALASGSLQVLGRPGDFEIPAPSGVWVGAVGAAQRFGIVRTFVDRRAVRKRVA